MSADGTFQQQASSGRATQCARQDPVANGSFAAAGRVEGIEHADITASKVGEIAGDQLVVSKPVRLMLSMANAIELNIMVAAAPNHCAISSAGGYSANKPLLLCSAMRPSGPDRPAMRTPSPDRRSSSSLTSGRSLQRSGPHASVGRRLRVLTHEG